MKTRKGRSKPRPLAVRHTMHLVLRSSRAKGSWSFKSPQNKKAIYGILRKFSAKNQVHILSLANVGNHLHLHIQLGKRELYKPFIRAITSAIAIAVAGKGWRENLKAATIANARSATKLATESAAESIKGSGAMSTPKTNNKPSQVLKFWDYRPFTRIIFGLMARLRLSDYIKVNQIEAFGVSRDQARQILNRSRSFSIVKGFG